MAQQTINLFKRTNIKAKGPQSIKRTTTSNYTNFNQLGKSKVNYTTTEFFKGKHGKLMYKDSVFEATGSPVAKVLKQLQNARPNQMGKIIANAFNPTKPYKALVENEKDAGRLHTGFDNPKVKSGAKVKKITEEVGGATGEKIVSSGDEKLINEYGSKFGKVGKSVREALEQQAAKTKGKEGEAMRELSAAVQEKHNKKAESGLKGVSNVFGSFMRGFGAH